MSLSFEARQELENAADRLEEFAGEELDVINLTSHTADEAPFLAKVVSKLSPLIGNFMELKIAQLLDENAESGFRWERQDPGFPDAVLIDNVTDEILAGYEVKAWYVMSTEITGRFRESLNLLRGKNVNVVIVAWCMSNIVYGKPHILGTLVVSGEEVARSRDNHYHNPPMYLTEEPQDTTGRTVNLQQSNVNGYRLQEEKSDALEIEKAKGATYTTKEPHSPEAQAEVARLRRDLTYRLDTNFAKIDRIDNEDIEDFKRRVMGQTFLGRNFAHWRKIMRNLESDNNMTRETAQQVIANLYPVLETHAVDNEVSEESEGAH